MVKVLLVNNYSMENAYSLWKIGKSASHHLWGKIELEKKGNVEMIIFPHEKNVLLNKIGKFFGINHLDQQIRVLGNLNSFDILYAPYSTSNTKLLLFLKLLGILRKPIVITLHRPILRMNSSNWLSKKFTKKLLLTYDHTVFLSKVLMDNAIKNLDLSPEIVESKFSTAQWGPDSLFYKKVLDSKGIINEEDFLISAGHSSRDYHTLIEAFRGLEFKLKIFCTPKSLPKVQDLPENVTIHSTFIPYFELLDYYLSAKAILIPLTYPLDEEGCQGMTSLQDVIALAKPMIITRNVALNLDVEKEGIGLVVDKGDVNGWVDAVRRIMEDSLLRNSMVSNSKRVFKEVFNADIFAGCLEKVFLDVFQKMKV